MYLSVFRVIKKGVPHLSWKMSQESETELLLFRFKTATASRNDNMVPTISANVNNLDCDSVTWLISSSHRHVTMCLFHYCEPQFSCVSVSLLWVTIQFGVCFVTLATVQFGVCFVNVSHNSVAYLFHYCEAQFSCVSVSLQWATL